MFVSLCGKNTDTQNILVTQNYILLCSPLNCHCLQYVCVMCSYLTVSWHFPFLLVSKNFSSTLFPHWILNFSSLQVFLKYFLSSRAGDTNPNPGHEGMGRFEVPLIGLDTLWWIMIIMMMMKKMMMMVVVMTMMMMMHRSELQSLANQTAYNVSQLLDNLLQVMMIIIEYEDDDDDGDDGIEWWWCSKSKCSCDVGDNSKAWKVASFALRLLKNSPIIWDLVTCFLAIWFLINVLKN